MSSALVDALIAVSVAYIGLRIVRGRPERWTLTAALIFAFGLVHGLGLATRLQALDLPSGGALVARVLAFNVGVEVGQLVALSCIVLLGLGVRRYAGDVRRAARPAGIGLAAVGAVAAIILGADAVRPADSPAASGPDVECTAGPPGVFFDDVGGGGHPPPSGVLRARLGAFGRRPGARDGRQLHHRALRTWDHPRQGCGARRVGEQRATRHRDCAGAVGGLLSALCDDPWSQLVVQGVDLEQLTEFRDRWFQDVNAGRA